MELCELAVKEPDPNRLISLTNEIVRLLDAKPHEGAATDRQGRYH
jgi:hypothetical protein